MHSKIHAMALLVTLAILPIEGFVDTTGASPPRDPYSPEFFSDLAYHMVGPSRGGRVTAVAGHRAEPSTFYMGATGGGVWKTTDYGLRWDNISDGTFATPSIGAIRVADSDAKVVYVGTGSDGLRSNVIIGKGVYKSTDAGETWEHVGLEAVGNIGAVLIHPRDPDRVYVAAIGNPFAPNPERGVYRSLDGGDSWQRVLFVSEKTGAVDLEFAPDNSDEIYATSWRAERKPWTIISGGQEGGVYKSSDGGDTWTQLTKGLPTGLRGKADLAVSAADADRVYVLIEAPDPEGGVYRSDDRGATWALISDFDKIRTRPFYYCNLEAHPTNPDILWGMAEGFWKTEDAGETWKRQRVPHGDNHDLWVNPDNPDVMVQANDGGANVTVNGGKTWSTQHNQPTAELYQVDISDEFPYRLYAGQQDNTTISVPSLPLTNRPGGSEALWETHGGCETGPVVPKPGDPDIVYANCKGRFGLFNRRTGQEQQHYVGFWNLYGHNPKDLAYRFQRVSPIHVSPHNPNRVYHTSQFVHVTEDGGKTWETISGDLTAFTPETQVVSGAPITLDVTGEEHFSTLYDVQESPHEPGVIWTGANDGPIHLTRDGGKTWKNVTPEELAPHGRVQNIEASPHRPAKAYATILRYQLGDFEPYAYKTENYGASWTRITTGENGIPADHPVRVVREDPDREGLLYAGTEFGMFVSFDDGGRWQAFQLNLPVTPVTDIKMVSGDLVLSTMGRGFWILYDITPLHVLSEQVATSEAYLYPVRQAHRLFQGGRRGPLSPDAPQYPRVGANINYYLASKPTGDVKLEILDAAGQVIREFSTKKKPEEKEAEEPETEEGEAKDKKVSKGFRLPDTSRLLKAAGMHRFTWDLRYSGPEGKDPGEDEPEMHAPQEGEPKEDEDKKDKPKKASPDPEPRRRIPGPRVPPGTYQARLTVGAWSETLSFEVLMDPRVVAEGVTIEDVAAQTDLALKVRDAVTRGRRAAEKLKQSEGRLAEIRRQLVSDKMRYSRPMLIDQLGYLYGGLGRADQKPGRDAYQRFEELDRALQGYLEEMDQLMRDNEGGVEAKDR